jgi:hypothetical protein
MAVQPPSARVHEERERLWLLAAAPLVWAGHFLASYATAAVWCAKVAGPDGALGGARMAIGIYTAVALVAVGVIGLVGYRRHRLPGGGAATGGEAAASGGEPHAADSAADRHRFLGFATLLLSALSAVAIVYAAMAAVFVGDCR